jgi:hypothetical protein
MTLQHLVRMTHEALGLRYALTESRLAFFDFAGLLLAASGPTLCVRHGFNLIAATNVRNGS